MLRFQGIGAYFTLFSRHICSYLHISTCSEVYYPLLDLRRYCFDLCALLTNAQGSKTEQMRSSPMEHSALKALATQQLGDWHIIQDPSEFLSFEIVARPKRSHFKDGKPVKGVGVGHTRMFNPMLFYSVVLIEIKLVKCLWTKKEGLPRFQYSLTLRLHTSRMEINYGDEEHQVVFTMPPGVESNQTLLKVCCVCLFN